MKIKYLLILFSLMLSVIGCSNETDVSNKVNGENEEQQESTYKNPPKVSISNGEEKINGVLGIYSWTHCCDNGQTTSIEASSDAPPNLVQNKEPFKVTSGTPVSIDFETPPIRYEVKTWNENNDVTGKYAEIDTFNHKGRTVFEVFATWEQGNASYSFLLDID
ncbi:hypothetical protein AWH56_018320 [Anaerobacillus isosaccharinicus]|uniref:Lipoprotein n=1 Tax=Anaerobacillus isosaccharinicus TaxID=1532552 RepID=A0A1S2LFJ2_9BACI|nr:hypothetical protein [Anaerobacillus isosaccharinicus]MBA5587139.1 hypothetical protein [Anaerobacillus isosaccharinicus]QOY34664.1 hypothetical protein AWH56_018320 [Anaerobacillus isosaccharinicus]